MAWAMADSCARQTPERFPNPLPESFMTTKKAHTNLRPRRAPARRPPVHHLAKPTPLAMLLATALATPWVQAHGSAETTQQVEITATRRTDTALSLGSGLPLTAAETPQSVSSTDRARMDLQSLFSVDDVLRLTTGVTVGFYDTQRPLYFARGFQITDFQVNGLPTYSGSTNQEYDTALYERVEVVRGANGLLSGAGLPSATVNLVRKQPHKQLAASVTATAGNWQYGRLQADVNAPLAADGRVRARLVAAYQDRHSHLDRYEETKLAWLAAIEADLGEHTTLTLGQQTQDNQPVGSTWGTIPRFASDGSLANLPRSTSFAPSGTFWQRESQTTYVDLTHRFNAQWSLRAALARTDGSVDSLRVYASGYPNPLTGAGLRLLAGVGRSHDQRDNVDLQLSGQWQILGRQHDLVLGFNQNRLDATTVVLSSVAGWSYNIPDVRLWNGQATLPSYSPTGARRVAVTDQQGAYVSGRWKLTDDLALITGLRLSQWRTATHNHSTSGAYTGVTGAYEVSNQRTPYLGAVWTLNPSWRVYASHTGIFNPQNFLDKNERPLGPVTGRNDELGLKGQLLNKRLNLHAALYRSQQDNRALRDASQPEGSLTGGASAYLGVDGTRATGLELSVDGQPLPGWTLSGGYTYNKTKRMVTDLIYANLPDHQLQLSSHVRLPGALSAITLGANLNLQSQVVGYNIASPLGAQTVTQGGYALAGLFGQWRINHQLSATLQVSNLFDKTYWSTLDYPNYGTPRNGSVSLRWQL